MCLSYLHHHHHNHPRSHPHHVHSHVLTRCSNLLIVVLITDSMDQLHTIPYLVCADGHPDSFGCISPPSLIIIDNVGLLWTWANCWLPNLRPILHLLESWVWPIPWKNSFTNAFRFLKFKVWSFHVPHKNTAPRNLNHQGDLLPTICDVLLEQNGWQLDGPTSEAQSRRADWLSTFYMQKWLWINISWREEVTCLSIFRLFRHSTHDKEISHHEFGLSVADCD